MKTITGGIVILAGAVLIAAGEISNAMYMTTKGYGDDAGGLSMIGGVVVMFFGLMLIVAYRHDKQSSYSNSGRLSSAGFFSSGLMARC